MLIKIKGYKEPIWTNADKIEFEEYHIDVIMYDTIVIRIPKKMIDMEESKWDSK